KGAGPSVACSGRLPRAASEVLAPSLRWPELLARADPTRRSAAWITSWKGNTVCPCRQATTCRQVESKYLTEANCLRSARELVVVRSPFHCALPDQRRPRPGLRPFTL